MIKNINIPIVFYDLPVLFEEDHRAILSTVHTENITIDIKKNIKRIRKNVSKRKDGTKKWKDIRLFVLKLKKYRCELCSKNTNIVHHIKEVCNYPDMQFDIENLMVLCRECHRKQHLNLPDKFFSN